jgi:hypothetical protein
LRLKLRPRRDTAARRFVQRLVPRAFALCRFKLPSELTML